jgi:hypothetical protein
MWPVGIVVAIAVTAMLSLPLAQPRRTELHPLVWDIPRVAATYTTILGALAGFSVVSSIFIANLTVARESPEFESVIGMFLLAFLVFMATAMLFGTTPNLPEGDYAFQRSQRLCLFLASCGYYTGIAVSWLALRLLLLAIELDYVADIFTWILLIAIISGGLRLTNFLIQLTLVNRRAAIAGPALGFLVAAIYGLGLAELVPELLPLSREPFLLAVTLFALGGVGFSLHTLVLMFSETERGQRVIERLADGMALVYALTLTLMAGLLWLVIARA